jgi:hypothetical protein
MAFSPLLFASKCRRYLEELVLGRGPSDILLDSAFQRDSVVQFIAACQGDDFSLTISTIFEFELLCDEWSVSAKSIRRAIADFCPPNGENLLLRRLLFRLDRGLESSDAEHALRCNLLRLLDDRAALAVPVPVMSRIVDFRSYEGKSGEYERLLTFCIGYLGYHGSPASMIMRT